VAYTELARRQRDFLLGCNPWGLSFVIGAGARYPLNPHHQIANLRGVELTGAMVGGPTSAGTFQSQNVDRNEAEPAAPFLGPPLDPDNPAQAAVYYDIVQDYVTNEPANDYTVKFLFLAALDAFGAAGS